MYTKFGTMKPLERGFARTGTTPFARKMPDGCDQHPTGLAETRRDVTPHEKPTTLGQPAAIAGDDPGLLPGPGLAPSEASRDEPGRIWPAEPAAAEAVGLSGRGRMVPFARHLGRWGMPCLPGRMARTGLADRSRVRRR